MGLASFLLLYPAKFPIGPSRMDGDYVKNFSVTLPTVWWAVRESNPVCEVVDAPVHPFPP